MRFTRRVFVRMTAALATMVAAARRAAHAGGAAEGAPGSSAPLAASGQAQAAEIRGLEARALRPLADVVLPAELGAARIERATAAFARWIAGYREGEELLHPYGSERIGTTGPSPAAGWAAQLVALDAAARATHGSAFASLTVEQRTAVVTDALSRVPYGARVPAPLAAPHVSLALVAHFLESSDAVNLAYGRVIDPRQCRPLAASPREPVAIGRGGRG